MNRALRDKNTIIIITTIALFLLSFMFFRYLSNKYECHYTNKGYICLFDKRK